MYIGGIIASLPSQPFDVVKTVMQGDSQHIIQSIDNNVNLNKMTSMTSIGKLPTMLNTTKRLIQEGKHNTCYGSNNYNISLSI